MTFETILVSGPRPHVSVVTMNRPEAGNAKNTRMGEELLAVWRGLHGTPSDVRCVILTGAGNRHFSTGGDLKQRRRMTDAEWRQQHAIFEAGRDALLAVPIPVIAAVNGHAYGGGCENALACDFIYAADTARFALPETTLGIMPGGGGTQFLPRAAGDLAVLAVSIDSGETPAQAAAAKRDEAARAATDPSGWHFLTGQSAEVAQSVGFPSRHDDRTAQYLHPAGLVVLTPGGVVSSYLLGVGYTGAQLREAVARAAAAGVAPAPAPLLLLCFHYDPSTGRYSLDVMRAVQAAGALTVLVLGVWLGVTHLRRRRPA